MQNLKLKFKIMTWIVIIIKLQGNHPQYNFDKRYGVITILDVLGTKGSWKD